MNAYSIYLTGIPDNRVQELPWRIAANLDSFKNLHPQYRHDLYTDESLREFIRTKFDHEVLWAYDELCPLAYKADLGRYCLLYEYGGIYSDLSLHFFKSLSDQKSDKDLLLFRDGFSHAPWIVSNSLIFSNKALTLFEKIIHQIVEHCKNRYYGHNPLCPTGPNLFGKSIAQCMDTSRFLTGDTIRINKNPNTHSFSYVLPDGEVCAVNVKTGAGIAALGASHHNNYNELYWNKKIYKSTLNTPPKVKSKNMELTIKNDHVLTFYQAVPDYRMLDDFGPYFFSSVLCRQQHFHTPLYQYWCKKLGEHPRFHRKQWEFVYICQVLYERGFLSQGVRGIGFGVGKEPLVSYFASCGVDVLATDLDLEVAKVAGWIHTNQHSDNLHALNERRLCPDDQFSKHVSFLNVDMNAIPNHLGKFDFCWSSCAFGHLGSIDAGLEFVIHSSKLLKPGGLAVHTTEYNVDSNEDTLDHDPSFVIFRKQDFERLIDRLTSLGFSVEPIDFTVGEDVLEKYIDLPPYTEDAHLRLKLANKYVATSIGLVIRAPT